jgi:hypothetical protein
VKVVPFTVPVPRDSSIHAQHEVLPHFYEHLHHMGQIPGQYLRQWAAVQAKI